MKLNYFAIFLIIIIGLSSATAFDRKRKNKMKAQTKTETKGNTWNEGYKCEFLVGKGNSNVVSEGEGVLKPKLMENPTTPEQKIGLQLEITKGPNGNLKNLLTKFGTSYYLPYRYCGDVWNYVNPTFSNKYIQGTLTNDMGQTFTLRINLPYATFGWLINDKESNKIRSMILSLSNNVQNQIIEQKEQAVYDASTYCSTKPIYEKATANSNALAEEVTKLQKQADDLDKLIKTDQANLLKQTTELKDLKSNSVAKLLEVKTMTTTLNTFSAQYEANAQTLKKVGTDKAASQTQIDNLTKLVKDNTIQFDSSMTTLKSEAPTGQIPIKEAEDAFKKYNQSLVQTKLGGIIPSSA